MKKIRAVACLITIAIMALIFFFSSQDAQDSTETSDALIRWFLSCIPVFSNAGDTAKENMIQGLSFIVRKTAHFTIYASLGMSSAVSFGLFVSGSRKRVFFTSTAFCMLYAISDELHQCFVSGRAAMASDVLIDTAGAAAGFGIMVIIGHLINSSFFAKG